MAVLADVDCDQLRPLIVLSDERWDIDRKGGPKARADLYQKCLDYLSKYDVSEVVVKATSSGPTKSGALQLETAEFRGIIIAAAATVCNVSLLRKSSVSVTYGDRKVDEYVKDNDFWATITQGGVDLDKFGREAAMFMLALLKDRQVPGIEPSIARR